MSPVTFVVDSLRDGRSFCTRRVVARQRDAAILELIASFAMDEVGTEYQIAAAPVPDPDSPEVAWAERPHLDFPPAAVFEFRDVAVPPLADQGARPAVKRWWARTVEPLPDDRGLHACVLAHLSDINSLTAIAAAIGVGWDEPRRTSGLDHCVHFHRPVRLDEWVLVEMCPISNGGNRGLVQNTVHSRSGTLAATVTQEGLLRVPSR